ncbi:MAG: shikimate dehydrogenase, partial [Bacteroidales bacterium]|nr:shikimate dehydrogenase [Bacteroidales bacterium]
MKQYGLLGYPLSHSFSCGYFAEKFKKEGIDAQYENYAIDSIDKLPQLIAENTQLIGLNVTIPYKESVLSYIDVLDPEAEAIGAVNTIRIERDVNHKPCLTGYNTDLIGFRESILPLVEKLRNSSRICYLEKTYEGFALKALILGTGGASKAVEYGLKQMGIETLYVSRSPKGGRVTYENLNHSYYDEYHIIVNTTPLGMYPNVQTCPPIDYKCIGPNHLLFDAVYNPEKTLFLQKGEKQ